MDRYLAQVREILGSTQFPSVALTINDTGFGLALEAAGKEVHVIPHPPIDCADWELRWTQAGILARHRVAAHNRKVTQ